MIMHQFKIQIIRQVLYVTFSTYKLAIANIANL